MRLTRFIKSPQVRLELNTRMPESFPPEWSRDRGIWSVKSRVLEELVELFEASGKVVNPSKLLTDLTNRERKASTALGEGVAIPHVRTMQARDFILCFARSTDGVEFDAPDGGRVHLFVGLVAPSYDDRLYLEVYRDLGRVFQNEAARRTLMTTSDEHQVVKVLSDFDSWGR
jgi:mannitol/fructose-specific phosphotransferase system IIA component (Ntr-type)